MSTARKWTVVGAVSLAMVAGASLTAPAEAAPVAAGEAVSQQRDGKLRVQLNDPSGASGTVVLGLVDGRFTTIDVDAVVDGQRVHDRFDVQAFALTGGDNFRAQLRSHERGKLVEVDSQAAVQQAFPVLLILGILARLGIKHVIRWYGKTQIKKAAKSYLLNSLSSAKWKHIMAPKHKWGSVGARSREQVAELMSRAMAEGSHSAYGSGAMQAVWRHSGKTIVVTYAKNGGKISNGWVR